MQIFFEVILLFFFIKTITCLDKEKDCKCRILPETKIIGGKQAHHLAYPWMASITPNYDDSLWVFRPFIKEKYKMKFHSCGGAIINEHWVLTAAHCIPKETSQPLYIGYGNDNDLVKIFDFGRIKSIRTVINSGFIDDLFDSNLYNDIALIQLEKPINFSQYVKPACFLKKNQQVYSNYLEHAGWGSTEVYRIKSDAKHLTKPKISRKLKEMLLYDESDTHPNCVNNEKIICAKGLKKGDSSCKGDSGGPIHFTNNGKSYVVGLTSYSNDILYKDDYYHVCIGTTIYTKVTNYISWIKKYVEDDICDF